MKKDNLDLQLMNRITVSQLKKLKWDSYLTGFAVGVFVGIGIALFVMVQFQLL